MMGCFTNGGAAATSATSPSGRSIAGEAAKRRKGEKLQLRSKANVQNAEQGFMHAILRIREEKSSHERPQGEPIWIETMRALQIIGLRGPPARRGFKKIKDDL